MEPIIRTTKHSTKFMNSGKKTKYLSLLNDTKKYKNYILTELWNNPIDIITDEGNHYQFNIKKNQFNIPSKLPCSQFKTDKFCTRLVSAMTTQVMGEIRSETNVIAVMLLMMIILIINTGNISQAFSFNAWEMF